MRRTTAQEQFDQKTHRDENGCLLWTGARYNGRYGRIWFGGKDQLAHRVAYEMAYGPIPEGMLVCHTCDVETCVEPSHLFLGTPQDNMTDKVKKKRHRSPKGIDHGNSRLTEKDVMLIFQDDRPQRIIAEHYGIARPLVSMIKTGKRWSHVTGVTYVQQRQKNVLTEDDVRAIRSDLRAHQAIADDFNIGRSLVSMIKNGQRWGHVT